MRHGRRSQSLVAVTAFQHRNDFALGKRVCKRRNVFGDPLIEGYLTREIELGQMAGSLEGDLLAPCVHAAACLLVRARTRRSRRCTKA